MSVKKTLLRTLPRYVRGRRQFGRVARRLYLMANPDVGPFIEFAAPGHFYSPIPRMEDVDRLPRTEPAASDTVPGIDLRVDAQLATLDAVATETVRRRGLPTPAQPRRYRPNEFFSPGDAEVYAGLLATARPSRVVEVGSGYTSALLLDVLDELGLEPAVTFVEPYSERLGSVLRPGDLDRGNVGLVERPVQEVGLDVFAQLGADDILFIDSSHVVKAGSDVQYLFGEVIPTLRPGVLVHVHDIFWPFEYPADWLRAGRAWNELYMVRALLQGSTSLQVEFFGDYMVRCHRERIDPSSDLLRGCGSLWIRTTG